MPDIHNGVGNRTPLGIAHLTVQPHDFTRIAAVIHPRVPFCERRIGHVQRPLNGARRTGFPMRCGVNRILTQVEEVFQPETCRQQRRFLTPAQFMQIVHRMPELFLGNIIIVDQGAHIFQ